VTRNGTAELFIQTAAEREADLAEREADKQINAMLKLVGLSKQDFAQNESHRNQKQTIHWQYRWWPVQVPGVD